MQLRHESGGAFCCPIVYITCYIFLQVTHPVVDWSHKEVDGCGGGSRAGWAEGIEEKLLAFFFCSVSRKFQIMLKENFRL